MPPSEKELRPGSARPAPTLFAAVLAYAEAYNSPGRESISDEADALLAAVGVEVERRLALERRSSAAPAPVCPKHPDADLCCAECWPTSSLNKGEDLAKIAASAVRQRAEYMRPIYSNDTADLVRHVAYWLESDEGRACIESARCASAPVWTAEEVAGIKARAEQMAKDLGVELATSDARRSAKCALCGITGGESGELMSSFLGEPLQCYDRGACIERRRESPKPCRRCSECRGENHHWLEESRPPPPNGDGFNGYVCKHCDATSEMCDGCGGAEEPGHVCEDDDEEGGDLEDQLDRTVAAGDREDAAVPNASPAEERWPLYEIDTDDVCTLEGFDGVGLMTGDVRDGLRMTRETARKLADRLHAWLRTVKP